MSPCTACEVRPSSVHPLDARSVSASKKELLAKKAKLEQEKIQELQNQIKQNSSAESIETMKAMNVSEDIVKQVQQKIESEARDKIQLVMGHAGYETFD